MTITNESHRRSLLKGVTWRFVASGTTLLLVFLFTGDIVLTLQISFVEVTLKIMFYYLHERMWGKVHWGILGPEPRMSAIKRSQSDTQ